MTLQRSEESQILSHISRVLRNSSVFTVACSFKTQALLCLYDVWVSCAVMWGMWMTLCWVCRGTGLAGGSEPLFETSLSAVEYLKRNHYINMRRNRQNCTAKASGLRVCVFVYMYLCVNVPPKFSSADLSHVPDERRRRWGNNTTHLICSAVWLCVCRVAKTFNS